MSDKNFERWLEQQHPPGHQTQPVFWNDNPFNSLAQPVVDICWFEARAYCAWLTAQTGQSFRLPSEAEWEAAARGTKGRRYAWGDTFDAARCNIFETHIRSTTPIGIFPQGDTPEGLSDMTGNVWEWTNSLHQPFRIRLRMAVKTPSLQRTGWCVAVLGSTPKSRRAPRPVSTFIRTTRQATSGFGWCVRPTPPSPFKGGRNPIELVAKAERSQRLYQANWA